MKKINLLLSLGLVAVVPIAIVSTDYVAIKADELSIYNFSLDNMTNNITYEALSEVGGASNFYRVTARNVNIEERFDPITFGDKLFIKLPFSPTTDASYSQPRVILKRNDDSVLNNTTQLLSNTLWSLYGITGSECGQAPLLNFFDYNYIHASNPEWYGEAVTIEIIIPRLHGTPPSDYVNILKTIRFTNKNPILVSNYDEGYQAGYNEGLDVGEQQGYTSGYQAGYTVGFNEHEVQGNLLGTTITSIWGSIISFIVVIGSIEVFGVSVLMIIGLFAAIGVAILAIKVIL